MEKNVIRADLNNRSYLKYAIDDPDDYNDIALIGRALSSPIRLEIIRLLGNESLTLSQIADKLDLPLSSTSFHLKMLEDCKLIGADYSVKRKGSVRWYTFSDFDLLISTRVSNDKQIDTPPPFSRNIRIGEYIDALFSSDCGIATERDIIMENSPNDVFIDGRRDAQVIWSRNYGFVEYAIENGYALAGELSEIGFSLELCSEALGYNHNYPSDITFWLNGVELCTFDCPGDFGNRYGKYTPSWWYPDSTKYGILVTINIIDSGVYLNGKLVNKHVNINKLDLKNGNRTLLKIGIKDDAVHKGGFNLFGDKFGDYNQSIVLNATYKQNKK